MTESQLTALRRERNRLLDAWRTAASDHKMAILVRIEDIDDQLGDDLDNNHKACIRPRRFLRR